MGKPKEKLHSIYDWLLNEETLANRLSSLINTASAGAGTIIGLVSELDDLLSTQMSYSIESNSDFDFCYLQLILFGAFVASAVAGHQFFKTRFRYKDTQEGLTKGLPSEYADRITENPDVFIDDINHLLLDLKLPFHLKQKQTLRTLKFKRGKLRKETNIDESSNAPSGNRFWDPLKKFYQNYIYKPSVWLAETFILPAFQALNISVSTHKIALILSIILSIIITGSVATGAAAAITGTATLSTLTFGLVVGVPLALGATYLLLTYSSNIWNATKRLFTTGKLFADPDDLSKQEEKQLIKTLAQNLALESERYRLAEEHGHATRMKRSKIRAFTDNYRKKAIKDASFKTFHPLRIAEDNEPFDSKKLEKPTGIWENMKYYYNRSKEWLDNSTARVAFSGISSFVNSFILTSSIFWFLTFVVSGILILAGVSLGGSMAAAPAGLVLAGIGVGVLAAAVVGSIYLVKTYLDERKHQYAMKESPELEPKLLEKRSKKLKEREEKLNWKIEKLKPEIIRYNDYVDHYNKSSASEPNFKPMEKINISDLKNEFDIEAFKKKNILFKDQGSTSPWFIQGPLNFIRSFGSGASMEKNALLILAITSVAFTTGPVAITIVAVFGTVWGIVSLVGSAIHRDNEVYRKKLAKENFELKQKEAFMDKIEHDIDGLSDEIDYANACLNDWGNGEKVPNEPIPEITNKKVLKSEPLPGHNPESLFDHHHEARERMLIAKEQLQSELEKVESVEEDRNTHAIEQNER
ncbi:MAG: hypothetical protein AB7F64_06555 [Gammaproteobacteria bacterium]